MRWRDANQRSARVGIKMRRPFAHQVWRPKQAFGAGWCGGGFFGEKFVEIAGGLRCVCTFAPRNDGRRFGMTAGGGERVAKTAQRKARRLSNAHNVPAALDCIAET